MKSKPHVAAQFTLRGIDNESRSQDYRAREERQREANAYLATLASMHGRPTEPELVRFWTLAAHKVDVHSA